MLTNKLCNPTKTIVDWNWHGGIHIKIQPDDSYTLSNDQLKDFQPGQPGSEAIQQLMNEYGIFLRDMDRTYEAQALEALKLCHRANKTHYEESTGNLRRSRASQGIAENETALEETFRQLGLVALREKVEGLAFRIKQFEGAVSEQKKTVQQDTVDPDRTLLFTDPPKTFETKFALQVFLSEPENAGLKVQYDNWRKALTPKDA
jgi:hypothetical protein